VVSVGHNIVVFEILPIIKDLVDTLGEFVGLNTTLSVASNLHEAFSELTLQFVGVTVSLHVVEQVNKFCIAPDFSCAIFKGRVSRNSSSDQISYIPSLCSKHVEGVELILHRDKVQIGALL